MTLEQLTLAKALEFAAKKYSYQPPLYHVNAWLWRRFRRRFDSIEQAVVFLFTDYNRMPRYLWLLTDARFLKTLFGRSIQEYRPNRYPSRHFGVGFMNVAKVLRKPNREPIERWQYHFDEMKRHVPMTAYLEKWLRQEELVKAIDQGKPTSLLEKLYLATFDKFNFEAPEEVSENSTTILIKQNATPRLT